MGSDDPGPSLLERLRSPEATVFEGAFREVYTAEKSVIYGLLLRLSGDADCAADLFGQNAKL